MNEQNATLDEGLSNKQVLKSAEPSPPIPIAEPLPGNWPEGAQAFPSSYTQGRLWFLEQLQRAGADPSSAGALPPDSRTDR